MSEVTLLALTGDMVATVMEILSFVTSGYMPPYFFFLAFRIVNHKKVLAEH